MGRLGGLASLAGAALGGGGNKDAYLEYLTSHDFTARFIEDEKLLPVLFHRKWDAQRGRSSGATRPCQHEFLLAPA